MEEFNIFIANCISNEQTNEKILRLDIYNYYLKWRKLDYNSYAKHPADEDKGEFYVGTSKVVPLGYKCKYGECIFYKSSTEMMIQPKSIYDKVIGQVTFYKLLTEKYGEPPIINKKTKQYKYYMKFIDI